MTTIEKKTKYYVFDLHRGQQVREFVDEDGLKNWLVFTTKYSHFWQTEKVRNEYLDDIALNLNDTMESVDPKTLKCTYTTRRYMFFDEYNRIIDARVYWNEVKKKFLEKTIHRYDDRVPESANRGDVFYRWPWWKSHEGKYYYRCGPVPSTGHRWGKRCYRRPQTTNEYKLNTDPEYKNYTRGKRRHLPTAWDDISLTYSKSWKDCTKKKKQWM